MLGFAILARNQGQVEVTVGRNCELCDRPLGEGYEGAVCPMCKQDFSDKYNAPVRHAQPQPPQPDQTPFSPTVSTIVNPTAPVQQVHIHHAAPMAHAAAAGYSAGKSRTAFILLGVFLGQIGIHNFYAGYSGRGLTQLLLSLLLVWTFVVPTIIWIWAIVEVCTVTTDANGAPLT